MPDPMTALAVGGTQVLGSIIQGEAAGSAGRAQGRAAEEGIAEERAAREAMQELLRPYVEAGTGALGGQEALLGLQGPEAQTEAIQALEQSPQFQALTQQGEEALLQNASATGGLRGGNLQGALAQYRPQVLSQLIESQFGKLGQVAGVGQAAAAGVGAAGQQTGTNIANLLAQRGQAQAGTAIAQGQVFGNVANTAGTLATLKAMKVF